MWNEHSYSKGAIIFHSENMFFGDLICNHWFIILNGLEASVRRRSSQLSRISHTVDLGGAMLHSMFQSKIRGSIAVCMTWCKITGYSNQFHFTMWLICICTIRDWAVMNAQKYLTNKTNIPNQHLLPLEDCFSKSLKMHISYPCNADQCPHRSS